MLRSILVALDATAASVAAQRLAIVLSKRFGIQITGMAVLDRGYFTAPAAVGIGGMAYKEHRDRVKLKEAKDFLARLERSFQQCCEQSGVAGQVIEAEGRPRDLIEMESGRHDLLVIGKDTDFHLDFADTTSDTVQRLLKVNPRPLLVCPERVRQAGPIVAAYDGSLRASRALHMLILLGLADGAEVHVVSVSDEEDEARRHACYATELFLKHDIKAIAHHNALQSWFLGSASSQLLNACPCPLFVHH